MMPPRKVALITGIAGGLAQLVARDLHRRGYQIVATDYRPCGENLDFEATVYQANYNKTRIEDIFRKHEPSHVLHLGRVGNLKERMDKRFDLNVIGSRKVMDLSLKYGVKRLLVLSTFHIYGAHPHNHIPIYEDEPLRAGMAFPQIADAIQLDTQTLLWIYQHPTVQTVLLRPCNVVGPHLSNAMSTFLRLPTLPVMIGFDPMVQLIHEEDLTAAVVAVTEAEAVGVYNVAGMNPLPWRKALCLTGARVVPVPSGFATLYLNVASAFSSTFPPYLVNFFKYPCVIADRAIRTTFGWEPRVDEVACIRSTVRG
jgi:UDP-glucose 4-epimerase